MKHPDATPALAALAAVRAAHTGDMDTLMRVLDDAHAAGQFGQMFMELLSYAESATQGIAIRDGNPFDTVLSGVELRMLTRSTEDQ